MSREVNFFYGVWDKDCSKVTTVEEVLSGIKNGEWKDEVEIYRNETDKEQKEEIKKQFLAVTFSGTFSDSRLDRNLDGYNNIMVLDLDLKDMKTKPKTVRKTLQGCPYIFCVFESPSGGFKALAYSRISSENHELFFLGVKENLEKRGLVLDGSGKNLARLCFVSYDPDLYLDAQHKRPFKLSYDAPNLHESLQRKVESQKLDVDYSKFEESRDMNHIMKLAKEWTNKSGVYHKGNRNNYIFKLSCILNRAGVDKEIATQALIHTYTSLNHKEIEAAVKSAYTHNSFEFGSRPIYTRKTGQSNLF